MTNREEKDLQLLAYLTGELTSEEMKEVDLWVAADSRNRLYFQNFKKDFFRLRCGSRMELIARNDYISFQKRLLRRRRIRILNRWAAFLVLLLGLACYFLFPRLAGPPLDLVPNDIRPGKQEAVLVLSTGEKVALASTHKELKEQDGTAIRIDTSGKISYASTAPKEEKAVYNALSIPRGGEYSMVLADGTKVWLNSATELKYPVNFVGKERVVYLKGEAYFDVHKNPACPFIVVAGELKVEVLGTEFNVNTRREDEVETVLVRGEVQIVTPESQIRLLPEHKAVYSRKAGKVSVEKVDLSPYIGWKEGYFIFYREPLENIMEQLSLWYDVDVFYQNPEVKTILLSGEMERSEDIRNLLYFFEKTSNVKFSVKGKTITIGYK